MIKKIQHKENYISSLGEKIEKEGDIWMLDFFKRVEKLLNFVNEIYKASIFKNVYFNKKNNLNELEKNVKFDNFQEQYKRINYKKISDVTSEELDMYFYTISELNEVVYKECHRKKFFNDGVIGDNFKLKSIRRGMSKEDAVAYIYNLFIYEIINKFQALRLKYKIEYTLCHYHKEKYEADINKYIDSIMYEEGNFKEYEASLKEFRLGLYGKLFTYIEYQNKTGRYSEDEAQRYKDMIRGATHSAQEIIYKISEISSDKRSKSAKENLYKIKMKSYIDLIIKRVSEYEKMMGIFFYAGQP